MKMLFFLLSLVLFAGLASASTVTLTGTCYSRTINQTNNYIQFNLTNSGNGTATNFLLAPEIEGASTTNSSILIPLIAPGGKYTRDIYLSNFTQPGSYAERFVARYSQGTSTFITLFPCLVNIDQNAQSLLGITSLTNTNSGKLIVNISNIADYPITAQISVYAPPDFTIENATKNITVNRYSLANTSFIVTTPKYTNAQFPVSVAVSYVEGNVHYATLAVTTISFGGGSGSATSFFNSGTLILVVIAAVIIIIIILIIISIMHGRKHRHKF
jgi:hypothetical protein